MGENRSTAWTQFQFTPLREGRRFTMSSSGTKIYFNSRPCERGDIVKS